MEAIKKIELSKIVKVIILAEIVNNNVPVIAIKTTFVILFKPIFLIASIINIIQLFLVKSSFL